MLVFVACEDCFNCSKIFFRDFPSRHTWLNFLVFLSALNSLKVPREAVDTVYTATLPTGKAEAACSAPKYSFFLGMKEYRVVLSLRFAMIDSYLLFLRLISVYTEQSRDHER